MTVSERWKHIPMPSRPRCHCATTAARRLCEGACMAHDPFGAPPPPPPPPPEELAAAVDIVARLAADFDGWWVRQVERQRSTALGTIGRISADAQRWCHRNGYRTDSAGESCRHVVVDRVESYICRACGLDVTAEEPS